MSRLRSLPAVAAMLAAAASVGCSDDSSRTGAGGDAFAAPNGVAAAGGHALIDAQAAYARCMRKQGVDMPEAGRGEDSQPAPGASGAELREADAQCERERRAIAEAAPKLSDADRRRAVEAGLRYARCMRARGQDVPDPSLSEEGGGTSVEIPAGAKENPAFQAATRECADLLREAGLP